MHPKTSLKVVLLAAIAALILGALAPSAMAAPPTRKLTVNKAGGGTGTVSSSPVGINCNTSCTTQQASFATGSTVTLTAVAGPGSVFSGWSACAGTGTCPVSMTANKTVTATFTPSQYQLTVTKTGAGS